MKKSNIMAVCAIVLAVLVLCSGCAADILDLENAEVRQSTEAMLDALIANDFQTAYSLVSNICTEVDFKPTFTQMQALLGNEAVYELKLLSIYTNSAISNGQKRSSVSAVYEMTTKSEKLIVSIRIDDQVGLSSFYLTPYEYTDYYFTGTLENMESATGAQWFVLLLNVIALGFVVFALVDCCRHKIKKKALWILLLILGFVSVGATVSATGIRMNFNVSWITAYSALIRYGTGTVALRLMLPVGAIVYFAKRRSLCQQSTVTDVPGNAEQQPQEEVNDIEQRSIQPPMDDTTVGKE